MRLFREKRIRATIPTASMADIAFLLIIFFMLTTSFSPVKTSVDLPSSVQREEVERDAGRAPRFGRGAGAPGFSAGPGDT